MKTKLLIGLCAVLTLTSISTKANTEEIKKVITRQFTVSEQATLEINNTFGNVVIAQGEPSVIDFRIEITGSGKDRQTAQRMADRASVSLSQNGNTVSARTSIESSRENCNNCKMTVDYLVRVPASVYLDLTNKYGNINVNTDAKLDFKAGLQYGNLVTRNLLGSNNNVTIKYGNINLGDATALTVNCAYGKMQISRANTLNFSVSYGGLTASRIDNLTLSTRYSDITVDELGSLSGSAEFSNFKIGNLASRFDLSAIRYGGVRIAQCSPQLKSIRIKASYSNVSVGLSPHISAQASLHTRYGNLNLSVTKATALSVAEDKDKFSKSFSGTIGGTSAEPAVIEISNSYANITLEQQ